MSINNDMQIVVINKQMQFYRKIYDIEIIKWFGEIYSKSTQITSLWLSQSFSDKYAKQITPSIKDSYEINNSFWIAFAKKDICMVTYNSKAFQSNTTCYEYCHDEVYKTFIL